MRSCDGKSNCRVPCLFVKAAGLALVIVGALLALIFIPLRMWLALLGAALAALILFINPVEDAYYYLGGLLDIGLTVWSAIELIRQHNLLASREIPVFTRKRGGDWNA